MLIKDGTVESHRKSLSKTMHHLPACEDTKAAEMSVLGAILLEQGCTPKVTALISENDFIQERNRLIFTLLVALHAENIPADLVTVCQRLRDEGNLERVGGGAYVAELVDFTPTSQNVAFYALIVKRKARERSIASIAHELAIDPGNLREVYRGTNLLKNDALTVNFNENGSSNLTINGVDATSGALGITIGHLQNEWTHLVEDNRSASGILFLRFADNVAFGQYL